MKQRKSRPSGTYYHRYILREDERQGGLLGLQAPYGKGRQAHPDEVLFIITHQTFELWFKQIIEEILRDKTGAVARMAAGDFQAAAATVRRMTKIARVLTDQYGIIETITPSDFLKFRDVLRPSSGYDSAQFRALELASGLRGDGGYLQHLTGRHAPKGGAPALAREVLELVALVAQGRRLPQQGYSIVWKLAVAGDVAGLRLIARALGSPSLRDAAYEAILQAPVPPDGGSARSPGWSRARAKEWADEQDVARAEGAGWDVDLDGKKAAEIQRRVVLLYQSASGGKIGGNRALFDLLEDLIEYDEVFRNLRAVHINMVMRVIGGKPGTGGSTGARYLRTTLAYSFFPLLWRARDLMEGPVEL